MLRAYEYIQISKRPKIEDKRDWYVWVFYNIRLCVYNVTFVALSYIKSVLCFIYYHNAEVGITAYFYVFNGFNSFS